MTLNQLLNLIGDYILEKNIYKNSEISHLSEDSRDNNIGEKTLFFAIEGSNVDGTQFIPEVFKKGCRNFITSKKPNLEGANFIVVRDIRKVQAIISKHFFNKPDESMKIIGITGTKGKTTISYMVYNALEKAGLKSTLIGTIEYRINNKSIPANNTTPGPLEIYSLLYEAQKSGTEFVSMEVSSHGLELGRVYGMRFEVGAFTNLSREHLDFHKTMENYFNSKMKLFYQIKELNPSGTVIINIDNEWGEKAYQIAKELKLNSILCSLSNKAGVFAENINISIEGNTFDLIYKGKKYKFNTKTVGIHNIYNAMIAFGCCVNLVDEDKIALIVEGINETKVKGRFEVLKSNRGFYVVIDYAHTHESLEKTLETARSFNPAKLTVVFGAGGNRDKGKRPLMGEVSTRLADKVIITTDNPRNENPRDIINDIIAGIPSDRINKIITIEDRKMAINEALRLAISGEIIVIAGKGHEDYQIIGNQKLHFSDIEEVYKSKYF
ncbi:MAG: UDP-N-acetylmuramoyl-L-alanyl-D-glutamate--2,6-diaminopimelate ligase [Brevinematia bacterium]